MDVCDELEAIDRAYGTVRIDRASGKKRKNEEGPELVADMMPFAPDMRASIEKAQVALKASGAYAGMLPSGGYTVGGHAFRVLAGTSAQVQYEGG